jgi:hypothetical protein
MNILRLLETEYQGDTNPGNYMGPDIDAFGVVKDNSDEITHSPESEAERKKRKKEKEDLEQGGKNEEPNKVEESSKDILDELLEDPKIQAMLSHLLGNIDVSAVHESVETLANELIQELTEAAVTSQGEIGPASPDEWRELITFGNDTVRKGITVETEHTTDPKVAAKIALAHLREDPEYYTKLARVEGEKPYAKAD